MNSCDHDLRTDERVCLFSPDWLPCGVIMEPNRMPDTFLETGLDPGARPGRRGRRVNVTTKQERPGDARSWAVFIDGVAHPSLRGMTRDQARECRRVILNQAQAYIEQRTA